MQHLKHNIHDFFGVHKCILKMFLLLPTADEATNKDKPKWKSLRIYFFIWSLLPTTIALVWDIINLLIEESEITDILEPLLAFICICGHHYLAFCFIANRELIQELFKKVFLMKRFRPLEEIIATDTKAKLYSKVMIFYSAIGSSVYSIMPQLPWAFRDCLENMTQNRANSKIPCGLPCRVRFPFASLIDDNMLHLIYRVILFHQIYLIFFVSAIFITLTMLLYSITMHLMYHFQELKNMLMKIDKFDGDHSLLIKCIYYHSTIIDLCQDVNEAFGSQMSMFITLPSFAISMLGFELLVVGFSDSVRYGLHLIGWICLLFLANYAGQILMDKSEEVAETAYNIRWYEYDVALQKDLHMLIMRAQKPEKLNAMNLGYMTHATFLKVISTAYSYFTLLIQIKIG